MISHSILDRQREKGVKMAIGLMSWSRPGGGKWVVYIYLCHGCKAAVFNMKKQNQKKMVINLHPCPNHGIVEPRTRLRAPVPAVRLLLYYHYRSHNSQLLHGRVMGEDTTEVTGDGEYRVLGDDAGHES
jgi:hypothetical protein